MDSGLMDVDPLLLNHSAIVEISSLIPFLLLCMAANSSDRGAALRQLSRSAMSSSKILSILDFKSTLSLSLMLVRPYSVVFQSNSRHRSINSSAFVAVSAFGLKFWNSCAYSEKLNARSVLDASLVTFIHSSASSISL
ncbi:hypothetical protein D3C75_1112660 [compost metagenome]